MNTLKNYLGYEITHFKSITSTNTYLIQEAKNGAKNKTVIVADQQTSGRGRLGRTFESPDRCGLYMSILLREVVGFNPALLTVITSLCVCESIEDISGKSANIKWVNDVYLGAKKVSGILTEGAFIDSELSYAVIGIGVNIAEPEGGFSSQISNIAGAILDSYSANARDELVRLILTKLDNYISNFDHNYILNKYREKSIIIGKNVSVYSNGEVFIAKAISINNDFSLTVTDVKGNEITLKSGEVSIKL